MTQITDVAFRCVDDLKTKLESLAKLKGKAFWVYNEDHLMDKTKGITFPAVGVVYEGIRAVSENQKDTYKVGFSGELVASVMVIQRPDTISPADTKKPAVELLDDIRGQIMGTKSPSGHQWRFVVEASASEKNGVVIWIQRWSTPVQLMPVVR
jgi:hypothetical protein